MRAARAKTGELRMLSSRASRYDIPMMEVASTYDDTVLAAPR
jgi:hypothetical protein